MARPCRGAVGERLAHVPVLVPGVHRSASVAPGRHARGGRDRRRRPGPPLPVDHPAAAARVDRPAADRLVRVQLQQLHDHLPVQQRRTGDPRGALRPRLHRHPDLRDLRRLWRLRRRRRLRPRQRAVDPRVHRRRGHLGDLASVRPASSRSTRDDCDNRTDADLLRRTPDGPRATGARRRRWWAEVGLEVPPSPLVIIFYAVFPLRLRVLGVAQPQGTPLGEQRDLRRVRPRELRRAVGHALLDVVCQHPDHQRRGRGRRGAHGRGCGLRVLALPLHGAAPQPDQPADRADVPAGARVHRDLPACCWRSARSSPPSVSTPRSP